MSEYRAIFEIREFRYDPDLPERTKEKPRRFIRYADFDDWIEHEHLTKRIIEEYDNFSDGGTFCFLLCIINKSNNEVMRQAGGLIFKEGE